MKSKLFVSLLMFFLFSTNCFAEGQSGLGVFIIVIYTIPICIYTFVGGIVLKRAFKLFKLKIPNQNWIAYGTAFLMTVVADFAFGDRFIFWGN